MISPILSIIVVIKGFEATAGSILNNLKKKGKIKPIMLDIITTRDKLMPTAMETGELFVKIKEIVKEMIPRGRPNNKPLKNSWAITLRKSLPEIS